MSSRYDRLRLHGLDSPSGTSRERELNEVLSALLAIDLDRSDAEARPVLTLESLAPV